MKNKQTTAIIQARMGSTRLANKMMLSLHGKPIIEWVIHRVKKSNLINNIVVAVPLSEDNDILENYLRILKVDVYRGSEDNVLERFYEASKQYPSDYIVRICADNPLIDAQEIDNLINFFKNNSCDYAYNHIPKNNTYPDGLGAEIIHSSILKTLYDTVEHQHHKEHLLTYINENSDKFEIKTFDPLDNKLHQPQLRFDIDTFVDYYKLSLSNINIDITSQELIKIFLENTNEIK